MPKFFIEKENINGDSVAIRGGDASHIAKVLRMEVGQHLTLCDGEGTDFDAEIVSCAKEEVVLSIQSSRPCPCEPALSFVLFQGIPKQGKMDYIIEKCTELGIKTIVPVACERSVVEIRNPQAEEKKLFRWRKIAAESVKQCGRGVIPEVLNVMTVQEAISYAASLDCTLAAYENERQLPLKEAFPAKKPSSIGVFIGPEGGFSDKEIEKFQVNSIPTVTLGRRILRTETAGHTVLTAAMYAYDEME